MSDRVRVTFEIPKKLLEFVDNECSKKSTEIMKWNRSSFLRKLIIEARDGVKTEGKKDQTLKWNLPKESNSSKDEYGDFLDLSGYKK
jgi:metal-responsive CopG/Arc/MetJ family transcriptional regulator